MNEPGRQTRRGGKDPYLSPRVPRREEVGVHLEVSNFRDQTDLTVGFGEMGKIRF